MNRLAAVAIVALVIVLPQSSSVRAASSLRVARREPVAAVAYRPGEVIVQFATATSQSLTEHAIREAGGLRARRSAFGERYLVSLDQSVSVEDAVARFRSMREVDYAEPNGVVHATFSPNDDLFRLQWNFRMIGAPRAWDIQKGKSDVAIAVIDTGIAYEDFGPYRKAPDWGGVTFLQGFDFVNGDSHANDDDSHGTHVASTIAEATNNGEGVAGLAFNCSLMPVKVLDARGNGSFFAVAEGVDYATNFTQNGQHPVKVINMSLAGRFADETLRRAIDRAFAQGIVLVAAAGNDNEARVGFPAAFPNVIGVGAVDLRRQKAVYSNFGPELDVVAPGGDVDRDDDNDGERDGILQQTFDPRTVLLEGRYDDFAYFYLDGTSQATPHVSALAALLISQGITDPAAVKAAIEQSADDLGDPGRDDLYGYGLINPARALSGLGLNR